MRVSYFTILALNAASAVVGSPTPEVEVTAPETDVTEIAEDLDKLNELAASAFENAQDIAESKKRGNTCNWSNVRVRREWSVTIVPIPNLEGSC